MHTIKLVEAFHHAFNHPVNHSASEPDAKTRLLRFRLIFEEVLEFGRAIGIDGLCELDDAEFERQIKEHMTQFKIAPDFPVNLPEAADALGDIDYVVQGANLVFGFPAQAITAEIHAANMSKLGADGKPIFDAHGKVVKGPNTRKPDIVRILAEHNDPEASALVEDRRIWGPRPAG